MTFICPAAGDADSTKKLKAINAEVFAMSLMSTNVTLAQARQVVDNTCALDVDIDEVRQLNFVKTTDDEAFRKSLYDSIGGQKIVTKSIWQASQRRRAERACACTEDVGADVIARRKAVYFDGGTPKTVVHPDNPGWTFVAAPCKTYVFSQ